MKPVRVLLVAAIAAGGVLFAPAAPASAEPCEGVDCVTDPVNAALCLVEHAKQIKQYLDDCTTILT